MKKIIIAGMALYPHLLFAGTDCRLNEYPDHFEAICIGDEKAAPLPLRYPVTSQPAVIPDLQVAGKQSDGPSQRDPPATTSAAAAQHEPGASQNDAIRFLMTDQTKVQGAGLALQSDQTSSLKPALSKRNLAKIEAAQMKEFKRKALFENPQ